MIPEYSNHHRTFHQKSIRVDQINLTDIEYSLVIFFVARAIFIPLRIGLDSSFIIIAIYAGISDKLMNAHEQVRDHTH